MPGPLIGTLVKIDDIRRYMVKHGFLATEGARERTAFFRARGARGEHL